VWHHMAQVWVGMCHVGYGMLKCYRLSGDQTSDLRRMVERLRNGRLSVHHALLLVNHMFSKLCKFDCVSFWVWVQARA
jgi:hypothetical protein